MAHSIDSNLEKPKLTPGKFYPELSIYCSDFGDFPIDPKMPFLRGAKLDAFERAVQRNAQQQWADGVIILTPLLYADLNYTNSVI